MQVVTKRAGLENALEIGDWLIEKSHEDPVVVFEVRTKLDEAIECVTVISMRLSTLKNEAHHSLLSEQQLTEMADDMETRLDRIDSQLGLLDPVSARYTVARQQHERFKPVFHEVQQLREIQDAIASFHATEAAPDEAAPDEAAQSEAGQEMTTQGEPAGMAEDLSSAIKASNGERVSGLSRRWETAWHTVANYHLQITTVLPFEERYHYAMKRFVPTLESAENELEMLQTSGPAERANRETAVQVRI